MGNIVAMILAGRRVVNSILSPGVIVKGTAVFEDSVIMHDTVIGDCAVLKRCIIDKNVFVGTGAGIGLGDIARENIYFSQHLSSGISIVGKDAAIPDKVIIGTNCIVYPGMKEESFVKLRYLCGETIGTEEGEDE